MKKNAIVIINLLIFVIYVAYNYLSLDADDFLSLVYLYSLVVILGIHIGLCFVIGILLLLFGSKEKGKAFIRSGVIIILLTVIFVGVGSLLEG